MPPESRSRRWTPEVCEKDLGVDVPTGKHLLQTILNGMRPTPPHDKNATVKLLVKAALYLRTMVGGSALTATADYRPVPRLSCD